VVAWLSGSTLVLINVVTLCRTRLILAWVTVCGRVNHSRMEPATKVNSTFYPSKLIEYQLFWMGLGRARLLLSG